MSRREEAASRDEAALQERLSPGEGDTVTGVLEAASWMDGPRASRGRSVRVGRCAPWTARCGEVPAGARRLSPSRPIWGGRGLEVNFNALTEAAGKLLRWWLCAKEGVRWGCGRWTL